MSVLLKRSSGALNVDECPYGCCTILYGRNVRLIRRSVKRREQRDWQKEVSNERH